MSKNHLAWAAAGFAVCFLVGGAIVWRGSYQEYLNPDTYLPMVALAALFAGVGIFLAWIVGVRLLLSAIAVWLAFPAVIAVRVVLDTRQDPTSHNLWPLEVLFAIVNGAIIAFAAACVGRLLRRFTHRNTDAATK
jgi:hypothetical protein